MNKKTIKAFAASLLLILIPCILSAQKRVPKKERVDNVILMIGDGMGLAQVSAYMIENSYNPTGFDRAEYTAICKTYSANNRVTDSAAGATAMATGCKTNNAYVGIDPDGNILTNITELAHQKSLSTAIIATSSVTDATPAGFSAHNISRKNFSDIAEDISKSDIDIIIGGGRSFFNEHKTGNINLIDIMKEKGYSYASNINEFLSIDKLPVLCLAADKALPEAEKRSPDFLAEATRHTLELISANKKGFFAMIEGSQIDGGGHKNNINRIISEVKDFDKAINIAFDFADSHPHTLVIVVADHETGGLTPISKSIDFTASESGMTYDFSTTSHSGIPVILYAYGAGSYNFSGVMENTDIFNLIKVLLIEK